MLHTRFSTGVFLLGVLCFVLSGMASTAFADDAKLDRLEKIILQQQKQIEAQSKAIESLREELSHIRDTSGKAPEMAKTDKPSGFWKSKGKNTEVTLYGQVNRGVLISDDGEDTTVYQVDNDNSSTRIGFLGSAKGSEDLEVGTKIEVQFESNSSSAVNQDNRSGVGDNNFTKRHLDLYLKSKDLGKLSVGFGSTASDSTLESDLSGTTVAGYSAVGDMAGGQLFYDNTSSLFDGTDVGDAFSNMDGLGRNDRIRYDSPSFYGLSAATSYIADGGGDIALRYAKDYSRHKVAAAASYSNHGGTNNDIEYQYGGSVSVLHDSGVSLSFSGGQREFKAAGASEGQFFYTKLGYQFEHFSVGKTALSIDYGLYEDIHVASAANDEATTFGFQFVQNLKDWGTEYYLGYRLYSLDRDSTDYEDINALLTGFRVKF